MGVAVGNKNHIGVAPKSKFITCKFIDDLGRDNPDRLLRCMQFMLAPHSWSVTKFDWGSRPHVVHVPFCETCDSFILREPIQMVRVCLVGNTVLALCSCLH